MHPLPLIALFFGGVFLMNSVPHTVCATIGRSFPSPFAKPLGRGLSSPVLNMLWGMANLVATWLLLVTVGKFAVADPMQAAVVGLGMLLIGIQLARHFSLLAPDRNTGER